MRALNVSLPTGEEPAYQRIAELFRTLLREGRITGNSLLPSTRDLASQFQVHRHTVTRGLDELVAEGWLESEPGRGYRVVHSLETELPGAPGGWPDFQIVEGLQKTPEDDYDFPSGKPDFRLFPDEFFRVMRGCLRDIPRDQLLGYSDPGGCLSLRRQLGAYLARMRGLRQGRIMITHGSQEAIFLLGQLLAKNSGRVVAVEELGYPPAWDALRLSGAELVGIPVDEEGLKVDALERLVEKNKPALLYLTPLHQYPTTVTLSLERRRRLLELISYHRIPVIEDDYDHEFHYHGKPALPLAGEDQSGMVVYVSTFSKLVYPSARVGYCLVADELWEPLHRLKRVTTRQNDQLIQETLARWMEQGGLDRHLRKMRKTYRLRMETMASRLARMGLRFTVPGGGMSLWVDLGPGGEEVINRCRAMGLTLRGGEKYALIRRSSFAGYVRLGFAGADLEEIHSGMDILAAALVEG